jgi:hypothetical protein
MDTIESLREELAKCVGTITSAGLGALDSQNIDKLTNFAAAAADLGMNSGKKLIENLAAVLQSFKEGSTKEDSVQVRLTALDFYLKNLAGGGNIEDL